MNRNEWVPSDTKIKALYKFIIIPPQHEELPHLSESAVDDAWGEFMQSPQGEQWKSLGGPTYQGRFDDGEISLYADSLIISKGLLSQNETVIPYSSITAVSLEMPGLFRAGRFQLIIPGYPPDQDGTYVIFRGGHVQAVNFIHLRIQGRQEVIRS